MKVVSFFSSHHGSCMIDDVWDVGMRLVSQVLASIKLAKHRGERGRGPIVQTCEIARIV